MVTDPICDRLPSSLDDSLIKWLPVNHQISPYINEPINLLALVRTGK